MVAHTGWPLSVGMENHTEGMERNWLTYVSGKGHYTNVWQRTGIKTERKGNLLIQAS